MKKSSTIFLQIITVLVGIGAAAFLLWEPHVEGVNAQATFFEVYLDPFILGVYIGSIPFFVALYQIFKVLGYVAQNNMFSRETEKALRTIKYCGLIIIALVILGEIFVMSGNTDERPPAIFMGLIIIAISGTMTSLAARFEKRLQNKINN